MMTRSKLLVAEMLCMISLSTFVHECSAFSITGPSHSIFHNKVCLRTPFARGKTLFSPHLNRWAKAQGLQAKGGFNDEEELLNMLRETRLGYKDERAGVTGDDGETDDGMPPQASIWDTMKKIFLGGSKAVGPSAMLQAVTNGNIEDVRRMIRSGVDVNVASRIDEEDGVWDVQMRGFTPLREAVVGGRLDIVQLLLEAGANPDFACEEDEGATSVFIAAATGKLEILQELIRAGANVNISRDDGATPLHLAVSCEHKEVVQALVDHGANVNIMTKTGGATPLREAVVCGRADIVSILLKAKADVNQGCKTDYDATPLCIAASQGDLSVVQELIKGGADVNLGDVDGATPVFIAVAQRKLEVLQELIKAKADVNAKSNKKPTMRKPPNPPILVAAAEGDAEMVKALIHAGADINLTREGETDTALAAAREAGYTDVMELLTGAGAR